MNNCAHKKLLMDGWTHRRTDDQGHNITRPFGRIKGENAKLLATNSLKYNFSSGETKLSHEDLKELDPFP